MALLFGVFEMVFKKFQFAKTLLNYCILVDMILNVLDLTINILCNLEAVVFLVVGFSFPSSPFAGKLN